MNWVAQGLSFQPGDLVLTTDQEHPGGRACWDYVARRYGVVLDVVTIPPDETDTGAIVERMSKRVTARTRVRMAYSSASGVTSMPSVIGLGAAMDYLNAMGLPRIEAHNLALRDRLFAALQSVRKLRVVSAPAGASASPLLTYALPDTIESGAFRIRMRDKHNIELKVVPKQWLNGNRVSTYLFNTETEVDFLVASLRAELA